MPRPGKRYRADEKNRTDDALPLEEAVGKLKTFKATKFDQSVDLVVHLGIDPAQADQNLRGALSLPHGIGKTKRVVAFVSDDKVADAKANGAIEAGGEDLVKKIEDGWMDFDVAVAEPQMMRVISKLGRTLGPKGLMPSPKAGTVTPQAVDAVKEFAAGKVEYRNDKLGNIAASIGKFSFDQQKLIDNAKAFLDHIHKIKPATTKGHYIRKIAISGTMTTSVIVAE